MRGYALDQVLALMRLMVLDNGQRWEPEPFQIEVLDALCRGVRVVWLEIPEGNGKSTLAGGIALAHLFVTEDANVPIGAASREQAEIIHNQSRGIVDRSGRLRPRFRAYNGYRRIVCSETRGRMQVVAADDRTGDGAIPSLAIVDELHRHKDLSLMRVWQGKLDKRDGQMLIISTAGEPGGEYELAKRQALASCAEDGEVSREGCHTVATAPGFEMHIWGLIEGDDPDDIPTVKAANPLSTVTVEKLTAKRRSPTWNSQHWARFTCGLPRRADDTAISEQEWSLLPRVEIPPGEPVAVGMDFGWKLDTTAIVPYWMPDPECRVVGVPAIIEPPRDGTSTPSSAIKAELIRVIRRNPITHVCMDPLAGGVQFAEWIEAEPEPLLDPKTGRPQVDAAGVPVPDYDTGLGVMVVEVSQSNTVQTRVYDAWMEAVRERWLAHPHDDDLTRHVLNAIAKPVTHDRYRFDRPNPGRAAASLQNRRVIDALIAASGVHWQMTAGLTAEKPAPINPEDYRIVTL